ncbi:MAG: hypothetical protein AAFY50_16920 [Cyanobacteria bacterium J06648_1]
MRLSGLYSSANIESQKPLILSNANKSYEATDIFLENPPLPSNLGYTGGLKFIAASNLD